MQAGQGPVFEQVVVGVRAIGDRKAGHPCVVGHQQIVRSIADHQGACAGHAEFRHQFIEHLRMGLGMAFIGTARRLKKRAQPGVIECPLETHPALARGDRQQVAGRLQLLGAPGSP